jgi:hypothetical protein
MALLIAIGGFGNYGADPFNTSADAPIGLNLNDKRACRNAIARLQKIPADVIDYVLVVENDQVIHNYGGQDGF